ncbi:MAG: hypothetical protein DRP42_01950 [Tenericutes bacterium]|nr:MAG: hypothetical protein DRP42_01950 [Mycoplasmatota bacterium]
MFKPVFESTSQKNNFVNGLFNVDENQELSTEQRIQGIPTAIIFKDGQEVDRRSGFMSADDFKS